MNNQKLSMREIKIFVLTIWLITSLAAMPTMAFIFFNYPTTFRHPPAEAIIAVYFSGAIGGIGVFSFVLGVIGLWQRLNQNQGEPTE